MEHRFRHGEKRGSRSVAMKSGIALALLLPVTAFAAVKETPKPAANLGQLQVISAGTVQFEKAQSLYMQGKYAEAITEFSLLTKNYPADIRKEEALFRIGECYRLLKQNKDAQEAYQYFISSYPNSLFTPNAQLRLGALQLEAGNYEAATKTLQAALDKGDAATKVSAKYYLGSGHLQNNKTQAGQLLLEELLKDNAAATYQAAAAQLLAQSYEKENKYADALRAWSKVLASTDVKAVQSCAAARGGWAALQLSNFKEAEALFETCRRLEASGNWRSLANSGLARICITQKRYNDLLELYAKEKESYLAASRQEILFGVATAQYELKKYSDAAATYDLFLKEFPKSDAAPAAAYRRMSTRTQLDAANLLTDAPAFLEQYPQSPYVPATQYIYAQSLSGRGQLAKALPYWKKLAEIRPANLELATILFEYGRGLEAEKNWLPAAETFDEFLSKYSSDARALNARARQAASLQNGGQQAAAITVWEKVRQLAPQNSAERRTALEQLGILYGKAEKKAQMVAAFSELVTQFPDTKLRPLAQYSLGLWAFDKKDFVRAEPAFQDARKLEPDTWYLPATERLALVAFALKDVQKLATFVGQYDEARLKKNTNAPRLPAALYFWLGENREKEKRYAEAASYFGAVTNHPQAGELGATGFWRLGGCQSALKNFTAAVVNFESYRRLAPKAANSPEVLVALAQAHLGSGNFDQAKSLAEQTMLQDLDGKWNAAARNVVGEVYFRKGLYEDAAKAFTALGLLYDDPVVTPQAMFRAAQAYEKVGNAASSLEWKEKLKKKYPNWKPTGSDNA